MADAVIGSTVQVLLEKVISLASDRIGLMLGFNKHLEVLHGYAEDIQAMLADAEVKQSHNPIVLRWLQKVERVAFEADNVLDELLYESLRRRVKSIDKSKKVCLFFSLSKHDISFRLRMCSKVRDINEELKAFNLEARASIGLIRMEDSLLPGSDAGVLNGVAKSRETDSLPPQLVAGRDGEVSKIVEVLLRANDRRFSTLAIFGMGGLGKTFVAKLVYNNEKINGHFSKKSWFCVSDKFEVTEIFRGILESLKGKKVEQCGRDALVQQVHKELNGERFLFVLDDVWNQRQELWDDFYSSLSAINTANGSCCLVTTRLQATANLVSTLEPFMLGKLLDEDCWSILTQRATKGGDIPGELEVHKNQILRRCHGLPLAANAIGGLLSLQKKEEWLSIVESKVLKVSEDVEGEIMPILRLSFDNLPSPSIKKCFAYCSIYVKDTKMIEEELVELWMAEGYIQEDVERRTTMEEVGVNYLKILSQSCLLEKVYGLYQMHDLVHDLAESISKREGLSVEKDYRVQHLVPDDTDMNNYWNTRSPLVRIVKDKVSNKMLSKFKYLHVLNLFGVKIKNLARSISKTKHLRYLAVDVMPESLCKLYNLQTLRLDGGYNSKHLPQGLSNLISFRHLHLYNQGREFQMPPNMGRLTCLQMLKFSTWGKRRIMEYKRLDSWKILQADQKIL